MDFSQRAEWEQRIAERLGKLGEQQRRDLVRMLGDPPDINRIPPEYWTQHATELHGVLGGLEDVFLQSAANMIADNPAIGVDWALVNRAAADWARGYWSAGGLPDPMYPGALVARFTEQHKRELGDMVARYYTDGWNIGQLREKLTGVFGPVWAEMVASTEVTRASVRGEEKIVEELRAGGIEMTEIWQTNNDELVCPICGPRHNKPRGDGWNDAPPAHPRCRCWVTHELIAQQKQEEITIPDSINGAQNIKELEAWARGKYPGIKFDFTDANIDIMRDTIAEFDKLAQQYPEVSKRLEYFGTYKGEGAGSFGFSSDNVWAHASRDGKRIGVNSVWYGDPERFRASLRNAVEAGWHPKGCDTVESVIDHEFGHQVNNYYLSMTKVSLTPIVDMGGLTLIGQSKSGFVHANKPNATLSRYGLTEPEEAWAEGFASIHQTPARNRTKYSRQVEDLIDLIEKNPHYADGEWEWQVAGKPLDEKTREIVNSMREINAGGWPVW